MNQRSAPTLSAATLFLLCALPALAQGPPQGAGTDSPATGSAGVPLVADVGLNTAPRALWPGPDGFGYTGAAAAYQWVEISATGVPVSLTDDSFGGPYAVGFSFPFYGNMYTTFYISSNGFISFGAGSISRNPQCPLPNSTAPNKVVALMWDDLDPGGTGDVVYFRSFGACPLNAAKPCLVVQYEHYCRYPGGASCSLAGTFEAVLFPNGDIIIQYEDTGAQSGATSTTGIEGDNQPGGHGLTYACNTAATISDGQAVRFSYPTGIALTPLASMKQGCWASEVAHYVALANHTGADGIFSLTYASEWPISGPSALTVSTYSSIVFPIGIGIPCGPVNGVASVTANGNSVSDSATLNVSATAVAFQPWESIAPISGSGRARGAAAGVYGQVYLLGGEVSSGKVVTVEQFNPTTGLWSNRAGLMPTAASDICAAAIGTKIYVPGGLSAALVKMSTLQVYDTTADSWTTMSDDPLPSARSGAACAALGGKLYVFGGLAPGDVYTSTSYVFNPNEASGARWSALPSMTYPRAYLAGAALGGKLYAIGGRDAANPGLGYVETYDPADGHWHTVTPLNSARYANGVFVAGSALITCGGMSSDYVQTCEHYDTRLGNSGVWVNLLQSMINGRRAFGYASLPQALYAVGGFHFAYVREAERLSFLACPLCRLYLPLVLRSF